MFTRSLVKGSGRIATTRSLVNNSTSWVLKNQFKKYSTSTPPKVTKSKSSTIGKIFKYTLYTAVISVIGSVGFIGYKIYEESQPVDQVKQTPLFPNGEKKKTLVILGSGWGAISLLKNLDTTLYNVVIVSPRNYFLFTPLLPSVPTGTVELRSIIEPVRSVTRRCPGQVIYLEAEATSINPKTNELTIKQSTTVVSGHSGKDTSSSKSTVAEYTGVEEITTTLNYDYLVVGVGAQPSTFGIPGVAENSTFLKEVSDASAIRRKLMDVIEAANILPEDDPERKRLLSIVVCGGGPTGVEAAGEIQDYIDQDLKKWVPEVADELKVSLVEALPNVLNTFNKKLIEYTKEVFKDTNINLMTNTMIKKVNDKSLIANHKNPDGSTETIEIPYGLLIWATGNAPRNFTRDLISKVDEQKNARRGLLVDERLKVDGTDNIFALGDCTFTKYPPTAQVAFQEGEYLANYFDKLHAVESLKYTIANPTPKDNVEKLSRKLARLEKNLPHFIYNYQGSLAYIGSEKAVADLVWGDWSNISSGGSFTFLFWRSAYIYMCLSVKNQVLVVLDWAKVYFFGRDCSKE
ncbi:mitochondrial external NADH-ubiquinone oxidoreductase precursor, putative [Candida dubliniensis CD36]|uniref:NADH:ubiquinone reductase (non-electrogenic) n=1 Tax=Candida dubliniensis (strain CD36 / ATCC MYA-646 / CBS 7987 / NCPF 3949 / NRRL Y-17841) TaxID=573826 RepID=B9WDU9_CANDC|nr:mitochondrial external NADH-ubiquinone oxidoreductase precursor, putative [Candida dubliniensis CD36]CAX42856.1 mitochondrial external NADH-ubiquinone oxidoreductase precursor, putative [Candida dubliniensis CD36]